MESTLMLSIDESVIEKAKIFAKKNHTSVSKLIESYLYNIINYEKKDTIDEISPLVKSLSGILKLSDNFDYKIDKTNYLEDKYK